MSHELSENVVLFRGRVNMQCLDLWTERKSLHIWPWELAMCIFLLGFYELMNYSVS